MMPSALSSPRKIVLQNSSGLDWICIQIPRLATSQKGQEPVVDPLHPPLSRSTNLVRHKEQSTMLLYVIASPLPSALWCVTFKNTRRKRGGEGGEKKTLSFFEKLLHAIDNFNVLWLYYKIRWTKNRTCVTSFKIYLRSAALLGARIYINNTCLSEFIMILYYREI